MLIPRFTLRGMLLVITVSSVFFLIVRFALQGAAWAAAISLAVANVLAAFLIQGALFTLAYALSRLLQAVRRREAGCPFATSGAPPQLVPSEEFVSD